MPEPVMVPDEQFALDSALRYCSSEATVAKVVLVSRKFYAFLMDPTATTLVTSSTE